MGWGLGRRSVGAPLARSSGAVFGSEPYQGAFHIVKQTRPWALRRALARDEHIVMTRAAVQGQKQPRGLAQAPLGPVAHHGVADLARGGESSPHALPLRARQGLHHHRAPGAGRPLGAGQEFRAIREAREGGGLGGLRVARQSRTLERALRRTAACGPGRGGGSGSCGRSWWTCAGGNHGGACARGGSADRCASRSRTPPRKARKAQPEADRGERRCIGQGRARVNRGPGA